MNKETRSRDTEAIILAAGLGSRLAEVVGDQPKCLVQVGGRSLLRHHLDALNAVGINRVLIVAGYRAEKVMEEAGSAGVVQFNRDFTETNSLYSLWLARKWVTGSLVLINGDVLADPQIYKRVATAKGCALAYDSGSSLEEEEMKVVFKGGRLQHISKGIASREAHGENLGILKFDRGGAQALLDEADRIVARGRCGDWAPAAVQGIAERVRIQGVDVRGLPWIEIDFPEDLEAAREQVCPKIIQSRYSEERARPNSGRAALSPNYVPKLAS